MGLTVKERVASLKKLLAEYELDGYLVPSTDPHTSEYPPPPDRRREYISGFSGSAGTVMVTKLDGPQNFLWTDGRYFLQANEQLDPEVYSLMKCGTPGCPSIPEKIAELGLARIGFDPYVFPKDTIDGYLKEIKEQEANGSTTAAAITLVPVHKGHGEDGWDALETMAGVSSGQLNLVDKVWSDDGRPPYPSEPLFTVPEDRSGRSVGDKLAQIREGMKKTESAVFIHAGLSGVGYLYNVRGRDVDTSCIFLSYAVVTETEAFLYLKNHDAKGRMSEEVKKHLEENKVEVRDYEDFAADIPRLAEYGPQKGIMLDAQASLAVYRVCEGVTKKADAPFVCDASPVALMKAVKNPVELRGMQAAHRYDAVALIAYLALLESLPVDAIRKLTETTAADILEKLRTAMPEFVALSFPSISSVGSNAAIIHYGPQRETAAALDPDQMYLIDSGGHYLGGTTDVTRTLHFGQPSRFEQELYTRVLLGHLEVATAIFPEKTTGGGLDFLARRHLWQIGFDYLHGTGHGVGHCLEVHEAPPSITPFRKGATIKEGNQFVEGMVVSNEPGAYVDGAFGIRIENLVYCKQVHTPLKFNDAKYMSFSDLTLVPYSRKLILREIMPEHLVEAMNSYHSRVVSVITPEIASRRSELDPILEAASGGLVDTEVVIDWLTEQCQAI